MSDDDRRKMDGLSREFLSWLVAGSDLKSDVKEHLQEWINSASTDSRHPTGEKRHPTMKDWVVKRVGDAGPKGATLKDLKDGFQDEFGQASPVLESVSRQETWVRAKDGSQYLRADR